MKTLKQQILATLSAGLLLGAPALTQAQYTFTSIDVPGSVSTGANGNSPKEIAGRLR